jgi:hypothetical protein
LEWLANVAKSDFFRTGLYALGYLIFWFLYGGNRLSHIILLFCVFSSFSLWF